jgi:hypothetical protein
MDRIHLTLHAICIATSCCVCVAQMGKPSFAVPPASWPLDPAVAYNVFVCGAAGQWVDGYSRCHI